MSAAFQITNSIITMLLIMVLFSAFLLIIEMYKYFRKKNRE